MSTRRLAVINWTIIFTIVALCVLVQTTACGASGRDKALRVTLAGVNAARDGFTTWDLTRQQAILEAATSREEATIKIAAYREQREKLAAGFELAYRAIAAAATQSDDPSLRAALDAAKALLADVNRVTGRTASP